jgi:hypothetical protein
MFPRIYEKNIVEFRAALSRLQWLPDFIIDGNLALLTLADLTEPENDRLIAYQVF